MADSTRSSETLSMKDIVEVKTDDISNVSAVDVRAQTT